MPSLLHPLLLRKSLQSLTSLPTLLQLKASRRGRSALLRRGAFRVGSPPLSKWRLTPTEEPRGVLISIEAVVLCCSQAFTSSLLCGRRASRSAQGPQNETRWEGHKHTTRPSGDVISPSTKHEPAHRDCCWTNRIGYNKKDPPSTCGISSQCGHMWSPPSCPLIRSKLSENKTRLGNLQKRSLTPRGATTTQMRRESKLTWALLPRTCR